MFVVVSLSFSKRIIRQRHETGHKCFVPEHGTFVVLVLLLSMRQINLQLMLHSEMIYKPHRQESCVS